MGDEPRWYVDVVFYHGEEREIPLRALKDAYAALCVSLEGVAPEEVRVEDGRQKKGCECLCLCGRGQKRRAGTVAFRRALCEAGI